MIQKLKKMIKKLFKVNNVNKNPKDIPLLRRICFESQNLEEYFGNHHSLGMTTENFQ